MHPTISTPSVCLLETKSFNSIEDRDNDYRIETNANEQDIEVGDMVSYKYLSAFPTLHRVVSYCPEGAYLPSGVYTKGDNNKMYEEYNIEHDIYCVPFWAIEYKVIDYACLSLPN